MDNNYLLLGLTGGIGSGKSTVANMLSELGTYTIDFDILAREVVKPGREAYSEILDYFGEGVLDYNSEIDRKKLGEVVFNSTKKRKVLESITHPRIHQEFFAQLESIKAKENDCIVQAVVPLLIESGMSELFQKVVLVYVSRDVQKQRLMKRDNLSDTQAESRLQAQMPMEEKRDYADYVINNQESLEHTFEQVKGLWKELWQESWVNKY